MPPKGIIKSQVLKGNLDFSYLKNVPMFAYEEETNTSIINEVNRAKEAEGLLDSKINVLRNDTEADINSTQTLLDSKINALRLNIEDIFGGNFAEIKAVYGNLSAVQDKFDSIDDILNNMSQPTNGLTNQVLTSRVNNLEQIMLNMRR